MQDNPFYGVGVAICDENYHAVVIPPRGAYRDFSGVIKRGDTVISTIEDEILPRVGFTTNAMGISHHNAEALERVTLPAGVRLKAVSPTVSTLVGLQLVGDNKQVLIRRGSSNDSRPEGLLKLGPKTASWAVDGDLVTHRFLDANVVAGLSAKTGLFVDYVGGPAYRNPIELLGNLGWVNAAGFIELKGGTNGPLSPDWRTSMMLELARKQPSDRKHRRELVSRLCTLAKNGDPFCVAVGRLMAEVIGLTIRHVIIENQFKSLAIQANSISAIDRMPQWMLGQGGMLEYIPEETTTTLLGWRPQSLEAVGAIKVASILSLIAA